MAKQGSRDTAIAAKEPTLLRTNALFCRALESSLVAGSAHINNALAPTAQMAML